ncbi:MAG TPA: rhamnan synthesis F family protein [Bosea sp. (in: a-proteobacteria)]|uniref:rhamnan synthesis F family protein n=1 Tax=Bosea sp. (in: a-proteobacteria) TaxID=1871050 RepID=UPI002E0F2B05|nr:rhamnan synthesis F family protein [Bosea sp. (in: a-proteobacteria)]
MNSGEVLPPESARLGSTEGIFRRIRGLAARRIALGRSILSSSRHLMWLALTLRFSSLKTATFSEARIWRARRHILLSGVFDTDFYLQQFAEPPADPVLHYLRHGALEGRWPHPLFDSAWYLSHNSDVKASGLNPLLHYILTWQTEGRRANAFFDARWYLLANADVRQSGLDPLTHYMRTGAQQGADPSPDFDTRWYLDQNGDVAAANANPLAHFLHHGRREGRAPRLRASRLADGKPVEAAQLHCLQLLPTGNEVALFVTHSPDGRLKPHLRHYLEALSKEGIDIVLIVAADQPFQDAEEWLRPLVKGLFVRENSGLDFAAWAHLLRRHRELNNAQTLYMLNDSLIGPTNQADFHKLVSRIRDSEADIVGMTENRERGWHIQSYFLAIKRGALSSFAFHQFMLDVVSFDDKDDVINNFEVQFAPVLIAAGLKVEALFSSPSIHNPTIYHWRELLDEGFPFIKVMTIRDDIPGADKTGWDDALEERGLDVSLAKTLLAELVTQRENPLPKFSGVLVRPETSRQASAPRIGFLGPWNYDNGLGFAARGYVSALMQTRFETGVYSVHRPFHIHKRLVPTIDVSDFDGGCDVAVVHLNPTAWETLLDERQLALIARAQSRVGLFVWESTTIPEYFVEGFDQVDRIWTPSRFCAEAFRAVTAKPVDIIPHVVEPVLQTAGERRLAQLRTKLGLAAEDRVILYIFDASSYLARKNPHALVRAFGKSDLARHGWKLVLKTKNLDKAKPDAAELLSLIRAQPGIVLLDGSMSSPELGALLDLADIYASSHSSEGFGLTIAEALARRKRVVATDYGGSRDFLTEQTGFPVRCQETRLATNEGAYARGTVWGTVDEDHFASCLVSAATLSPGRLREIEEAAHRMVQDNLSSKAVAAQIEASLALALASRQGLERL